MESLIKIDKFVEILKEYKLNSDQIENLWTSKPCGLDEQSLRKVVDLLAPLMNAANAEIRVLSPKRTREELKRSLQSRYNKTKRCQSKERAMV